MDEERQDKSEKATVVLDRAELLIVVNALNEICHGVHIDDFEFHARIGADRDEAQALLDRLIPMHDRLGRTDD